MKAYTNMYCFLPINSVIIDEVINGGFSMKELSRTSWQYLCGNVALYDAGINDFIGSAPITEGKVGAFTDKFNYKLHLIAENKTPLKIIASFYVGCFSFDTTDEEQITVREFDPSEEGLNSAFEWLDKEYNNCI